MAYIDVTPIIPNTTMQQYVNLKGVATAYKIIVNEGYALHDKNRDFNSTDENGNPIVKQGFTTAYATCPITYDFDANPREFFTQLIDEIPADQIFGGGNNNHEIM